MLERSLPAAAYTSREGFAADRRAILTREWLCVGRAEELAAPGDHRVLDVAGESILLVRDGEGHVHGHHNLCRHRGARLCDPAGDARWGLALDAGVIGAKLIRCPYHSWAYALDGRLLAAPHLQDEPGFDKAAHRLAPVGVAEWGGFLFATLRPGEAPRFDPGEAARRLGNYPLADCVTVRTLSYEVAANWKIVLENYNECYHCPGVHPELCAIVPAFREKGGIGLDWAAGVPHRDGAVTYTASGTTRRPAMPGLDADERVRHKGELFYPNLMLSVSMDHAAAFLLWPQAADRTRIECRFLFHPQAIADPGFDPSDAVDFWDLVNRQDWAVCERVQAGSGSLAFEAGWYSPMEDASLDIRRYVADRHARYPA